MLKDGNAPLPNDEKLLLRQIHLVRARMLPGGKYKYTTNGLDLVSAAIFIAHRSCFEVGPSSVRAGRLGSLRSERTCRIQRRRHPALVRASLGSCSAKERTTVVT